MSYLISISIGPVQDFIASARRSRDLWFGSWLLSELSKSVAKSIGEDNLVFPGSLKGNVVNKLLAIVAKDKLDTFESDCRNTIKVRLNEIYSTKFKEIKDELRKVRLPETYFREDIAIAQINDLVEFYWAAIPYDKDNKIVDATGKSEYEKKRERVEILLSARKTTRDFHRVTWGSIAPKSSLDGQRESVIEDDFIKNDEIKAQKIFGLRKKERLCGVGVLKRLAEKGNDDSFFSTSHVASLPLLLTLKNDEKTKVAVEDYVREISRLLNELENIHRYVGKVPDGLESDVFGKYDGHLLFENRLADLPFENKESLEKAKEALLGVPEKNIKGFLEKAFGKNKKPNPYFALLQADGDRMGIVIDNQKNPDDHKELSKVLSGFANEVKEIVKKHNGCLIYAGGDDVLALLPLHTVLDCSRELADNFKNEFSKNSKFVDEKGNPPTLSAGIAICHHTEPLQDSLETMRKAEKEAKLVDGKNALAIILSKRSGSDTTIKGSWTDDRKTGKSFDERFNWFIQLHLDDALPDGVAYELRDLWLRFSSVPSLKTAMEADAVRILNRKKSNQGLTQVSKDILDHLKDLILNKDLSLEDLANEIIVARDFAKAYKQAKKQAIGGTI